MNSPELVPDREAVEQEEIARPVLATEKLVGTPEDPTTTVPKFTVPVGEKLSLAADALKERAKKLRNRVVRNPTFVVSIKNYF
jgi:hypothetical protein